MSDNVNHPAHYAPKFETKPVECIDITRNLPFSLGNAFKYVWRAGDKGDRRKAVEDLEKAQWYLRDAADDEFIHTDCREARLLFDMLVDDGSMRFSALHAIICGRYGDAFIKIEKLKLEIDHEN